VKNLPIGPLLNLLGRERLDQVAVTDLARVDRSGFNRAVQRGHISMWTADRIAIQLNTHPLLIWGDQWLDADHYLAGRIDEAFDALKRAVAS
jgi:hypothetical protein